MCASQSRAWPAFSVLNRVCIARLLSLSIIRVVGKPSKKRKLLEKQKEGKRRMKSIGRVDVPQEAFVSALRLGE